MTNILTQQKSVQQPGYPSRPFGILPSLIHSLISRASLVALSLLCISHTVLAEDAIPASEETAAEEEVSFTRGFKDMFRFSGFGTLGVAGSDNDRADFIGNFFQPNGAGYTRDWSTTVDSRLGVQLTYLPTDKFSAVLQVTAEQEYDNSWDPDVEWAFLQYDFTPNLSLRAGRMILPLYMFSEFRKVGFALPWIRPPGELYNVPNNTTDGLGVLYTHHFGEMNYTFYGVYGEDDSRSPGGSHTRAREGLTLSNTFEYKDTTFRAAYSRIKLTIEDVDDLFAIYRVFGSEGEEIYDEFSIRDREYAQFTLGVWHDPGKWFVGGEWSRAFTDTFLPPGNSWYVTGGYRINKFTPYLTYSQTRLSHGSIPMLSAASGPPFVVAPLNDLLVAVVRPIRQSTVAVGTRWDFAENASFKVQLDHIMTEENSSNNFINIQPNFDEGDSVNILSFTVDFVF